jgi:hypothetical protein
MKVPENTLTKLSASLQKMNSGMGVVLPQEFGWE